MHHNPILDIQYLQINSSAYESHNTSNTSYKTYVHIHTSNQDSLCLQKINCIFHIQHIQVLFLSSKVPQDSHHSNYTPFFQEPQTLFFVIIDWLSKTRINLLFYPFLINPEFYKGLLFPLKYHLKCNSIELKVEKNRGSI